MSSPRVVKILSSIEENLKNLGNAKPKQVVFGTAQSKYQAVTLDLSNNLFFANLTIFHAPYRNLQQAQMKIRDRNTRGARERSLRNWHTHTLNVSAEEMLDVPNNSFELNKNFMAVTQLERNFKVKVFIDH